jgi:hypothetical protein
MQPSPLFFPSWEHNVEGLVEDEIELDVGEFGELPAWHETDVAICPVLRGASAFPRAHGELGVGSGWLICCI